MEHHGTPWQSDRGPAPAAVPFVVPQTATPTASPILSPALTPMALSPPRPVLMMRHSSCDLFECIEQHSRFSEDTARHVFAQVVEVVYQLGKLGICHRDIKDENIVVSADFQVSFLPRFDFPPSRLTPHPSFRSSSSTLARPSCSTPRSKLLSTLVSLVVPPFFQT